MENNFQIKISDLKEVLNLLMLKLDGLNDVSIEKDLYWNIPDEKLYSVYEDPIDLTIGSLVEDWTFLQDIVLCKREIIGYDLYKLSMLIRYLSTKIE